jgi:tetratricopeptide (TPR) repeat protein
MADPTQEERYARVLVLCEQQTANHPNLVRDALTALTVARCGLREDELLTYLGWPSGPLPVQTWLPIYHAFEEDWLHRTEQLEMSPPLRNAVFRRYLASEEALTQAHQRFADYCAGCDLNERKVEEYPWQLAKARNWSQLYRVLADLSFFAAAWKASITDVRAYWAQIESQSPLRMAEAYEAVVDDPVRYLVQAEGVGRLLHETGHCVEAARLRRGLVEYYRQGADKKQLAYALADLSASLRRTGELDRAMQLLLEEEPLLHELHDEWNLAYCIGAQGIIHVEHGNLDAALDLFRQQEQMARRLKNNFSLIQALGNQSLILGRQGKHAEELRLLQEVEKLCRTANKLDDLATTLTNQAAIHIRDGNPSTALEVLAENEQLCESAGDPPGLVSVYRGQAQALADLGRFVEAVARQEMQEALCRRLRAWPELAQCLWSRALFCKKRGDNAAALRFLQQAEELFHRLGDARNLSSALAKHAEIAKEMGNHAAALAALTAQDSWLRHLRQTIDLGRNLRDRADILINQEKTDEALLLLSESEQLFRTAGNKLELAVTLLYQAICLRQRRDARGCVQRYDDAEDVCRQGGPDGLKILRIVLQERSGFHLEAKETALALETLAKEAEVQRQLGDAAELQLCLEQRANVLYRNGREEEALPLYLEQEQVCRQSNNAEALQRCLGNQGLVHTKRKDLAATLKLYEEQVAICRQQNLVENLASALGSLASTFWKREQWEQALEAYQEQEAIDRQFQKKDALARSLQNQALIHRDRGTLDEGLVCFQKEEELLRELGDRATLQVNLGNQAVLHRRRMDPHKALELYEQQEALARELGDMDSLQACLCDKGNVYYDFRLDLDRGLACYQEGERICTEARLLNGLQIVLGNQGLIHTLRKETTLAVAVYRRKEEVLRELKNNAALLSCLEALAVLLHNNGDPDSALPMYQEIEQLSRAADNKVSLRICLGNQVLVYKTRKDWNSAAAVQRKKIELLRESQDKGPLLEAVVELENLEAPPAQPAPVAPVAEAVAGVTRSENPTRTSPPPDTSPVVTDARAEKYDVFISYAHQDNHGPHQGWVKQLVLAIRELHARFTPRPLEVFLDLEEIRTADDWEHRILRGLRLARLMVAVLSPAYFNSDYCRREWEIYCDHEAERAMRGQGIAPIYIVKAPDFDSAAQGALDRWRTDLKRRQYLDLQDLWQEGIQALQREDVRQRLEHLDQILTDRLNQVESFLSSPTKVPQHNRNFVGREEELRRLREVLAYGRVGAITAVHGLAGMGKSALAFEYAHAYGSEYPGGRFLISAAGARELPQLMIAIADQKGVSLTDQERQNPALAVARVRSAFEQGQCALVILDNVDDANLMAPQQRAQFLPSSNSVHFLVTTRLSPDHLAGLECLPLNPLPEEDGRRLLEKHRPFKDDEEWKAAVRIVRRLGGYTLALEVVAVFLWKNPDISYGDYLARLEQEGLGAVEGAGSDPLVQLSRHPEKLIGPLLEPTLVSLTPEERCVVEYAALLSPDRIPLPWLRELTGIAFPDLLRKPRPGYPDLWERMKRRLFGLRLLDSGDNANLVRMHRVVQEVIRARMPAEERDQRAQATQAYVAQRTQMLDWVERGNRWEIQPVLDYTADLVMENSPAAPVFLSQILEPVRYMAEIERGRKDYQQALALLKKEAELLRKLTKHDELQAVLAPPVGDDVQFTVYRPRAVVPDQWYTLIAFAHLAAKPSDAPADEPDPAEEVRRQAVRVLGEREAAKYRAVTQDAPQPVPREETLTFVPEVPGVEFNPPLRSFRWTESVHREEFRLRASLHLVGQTARGRLSVFLGDILLADVSLAIPVDQRGGTPAKDAPAEAEHARRYRKIFASYSHKDVHVVEQFEHLAQALGDAYLRDWKHLRAGEVWDARLLQMIEEADIFQLFWSRQAMESPHVRREYEYALSLNRPNFVRPTYWEDPLPSDPARNLPPETLLGLHFQRIGPFLLSAVERPPSPPATRPHEGATWDMGRTLAKDEELQAVLAQLASTYRQLNDPQEAADELAILAEEEQLCRKLHKEDALQACLGQQATVYKQLGKTQESLACLQEQAQRCRTLNNREALQVCLGNQATLYKLLRRIGDALACLQEQEIHCRKLSNWQALQFCLCEQGNLLYDNRVDLSKALALYEEQEKICRRADLQAGLQVALGNQGLVRLALGEQDAALELFQRQEELCQRVDHKDGLEFALGNQANVHKTRGNVEAALQYYRRQQIVLTALNKTAVLITCLENQAVLLHNRGDLDAALPLYLEIQRLCEETKNRVSLRICLGNQGLLHKTRKNWDAALTALDRQDKLCRELRDDQALAICIGEQGHVRFNQGNLPLAFEIYQTQEQLCRDIDYQAGLQYALGSQALVHFHSKRHEEALETYAKAADLARRRDDKLALQGCLEMMARIHYDRGEQDEALQLAVEQEAICRAIGFKPGLAFSSRAQAIIWHRRNEPARALTFYREAETLYRALGNPAELQYCLENLARLYHAHNNVDAALACLSEQETLCRQLNYKPGLAFSLNSQGFLRHQRNQLDEALRFYQEAEPLFRELNNKNELHICLENQARILNTWKETEAALEKYRAQEKILRELEETVRLQACLGNQAAILHGRGEHDEALKLYSEEERLCRLFREREGLQFALHNQGRIHHYVRGDSARARPLVEEAVQLLRDLPGLDRLASALIDLGNICSDLDHPETVKVQDEAVSLYRRLVEEGRSDLAGDLAVSLNNKSAALEAAGRVSDALACIEEAIPIYRQQLEQGRPGQAFLLGMALSNRGYYLHDLDRAAEALEAGEQAISLLRPLMHEGVEQKNCLASALTNVGDALVSLQRPGEALPCYEEAIALRGELAETASKSRFNKDRAWSLTNLGLALALVGKTAEALAAHDEAIAIYQQDIATQPHLAAQLARALVHKGEALEQLEQASGADDCYLRSLELLLPQAGEGKAAALAGLADSLRHRYTLLARPGRTAETAEVLACVQRWLEPVIKDGSAAERVVQAYHKLQSAMRVPA